MSHEKSSTRKYELRKRAEQVADTRRRITEAAIALHGTVGPARTTLSAVAERAGVERRTLYRHFATEADLFVACSTHYYAEHPWPDLGAWRAIGEPRARLATALDELYAHYERTAPMYRNVLRDADAVAFARDAVAPLQDFLDEATAVLMAGRGARGRRRALLEAALRHALAFSTWDSLAGAGVGRADAVALVTAMVEAADAPRSAGPRAPRSG
jgi:AcrR family transcriptional regulator